MQVREQAPFTWPLSPRAGHRMRSPSPHLAKPGSPEAPQFQHRILGVRMGIEVGASGLVTALPALGS